MLCERNRVCDRMSRRFIGVAFMASLLVAGGAAFGQDEKSGQDAEAFPVHVVKLKHIDAGSVAETLQRVYLDTLRVVPEPSANSLVISAQEARLKSVLELVRSLDVQRVISQRPEILTKTIKLKHNHSPGFPALLNRIIEGTNKRGQVALDEERNLLILQGEDTVLTMLELLVRQLDLPVDTSSGALTEMEGRQYQVRVVWLVSDSGDAPLRDVPPDMKEVVAELNKIGVSDLRLAAQMMVAAMPGERFVTQGATELDGQYMLEIGGEIVDVDRARVRLELGVEGSGMAGMRRVEGEMRSWASAPLNVRTTIIAAAGQSVVLAVTPLGARTSVLVVQVSPVK